MRSPVRFAVLAVLALTAAFAAAAAADTAGGRNGAARSPGGGPLAACKADVQKLCKGTQPGGGRVLACLEAKKSELSKPCQAATQRAQRVAKLRQACGADVAKLCKDAKQSGGVLGCLRENQSKLSASCQALVAKKPSKSGQGQSEAQAPAQAPAARGDDAITDEDAAALADDAAASDQ
jgi:cysteine rich repeat protein